MYTITFANDLLFWAFIFFCTLGIITGLQELWKLMKYIWKDDPKICKFCGSINVDWAEDHGWTDGNNYCNHCKKHWKY